MIIAQSWTEFKNSSLNQKKLYIQYVEETLHYYIFANENGIIYDCTIFKTDPINADQIDFEDNYKTNANKTVFNKTILSDGEYCLAISPDGKISIVNPIKVKVVDNNENDIFGEKQSSPTQYTLLGRLKDLWDKLGTFLTVKIYDKNENGITSKDEGSSIRSLDVNIRSGQLIIAPNLINTSVQILYDRLHSAVNSGEWQEVLEYKIPVGYNLNVVSFEAQSQTANEAARAVYKNIMGTFQCSTDTFTDAAAIILPRFATRLYAYATSNIGSGVNDTFTVTYTNLLGQTGRIGTVTFTKSSLAGTRFEVTLQKYDKGFIDITNITHTATGQAGAVQFEGYIELLYLTMTSSNIQYQSSSISLGGLIVLEGETIYLQYLSATKTTYTRRLNLLTVLVPK